MNKFISSQTPQTAPSTLALAIGATMAAGPSVWPVREAPSYIVTETAPSYSQLSEQINAAAKQPAHADFARDMATIYASLSERQKRLGNEFEEAIFGDLDSLYES